MTTSDRHLHNKLMVLFLYIQTTEVQINIANVIIKNIANELKAFNLIIEWNSSDGLVVEHWNIDQDVMGSNPIPSRN